MSYHLSGRNEATPGGAVITTPVFTENVNVVTPTPTSYQYTAPTSKSESVVVGTKQQAPVVTTPSWAQAIGPAMRLVGQLETVMNLYPPGGGGSPDLMPSIQQFLGGDLSLGNQVVMFLGKVVRQVGPGPTWGGTNPNMQRWIPTAQALLGQIQGLISGVMSGTILTPFKSATGGDSTAPWTPPAGGGPDTSGGGGMDPGYSPYAPPASAPSWLVPAVVGAAVLLLVFRRKA